VLGAGTRPYPRALRGGGHALLTVRYRPGTAEALILRRGPLVHNGAVPNTSHPDSSGLNRQVLSLAVPALGALIAEPLFVLADSAMVGHLGAGSPAGGGEIALMTLRFSSFVPTVIRMQFCKFNALF